MLEPNSIWTSPILHTRVSSVPRRFVFSRNLGHQILPSANSTGDLLLVRWTSCHILLQKCPNLPPRCHSRQDRRNDRGGRRSEQDSEDGQEYGEQHDCRYQVCPASRMGTRHAGYNAWQQRFSPFDTMHDLMFCRMVSSNWNGH